MDTRQSLTTFFTVATLAVMAVVVCLAGAHPAGLPV